MDIKNMSIKKTKIVATSGPSFQTEDEMREMFKRGVNVVRFNVSHGDIEEHLKRIKAAKKIREELNVPISLLLDTKGPEIRLHTIEGNKLEVKVNDVFKIHTFEEILGRNKEFSITYRDLINTVVENDDVLVDDGKLLFKVKNVDKKTGIVTVVAKNNHFISSKKAINIPGKELKLDFLNEKDRSFIKLAIKEKFDYIAASFVSNKENLFELKDFLKKNNGEDIEIISKIESLQAIYNLTDIIKYSDGIMFARGDLGVEIPYYKVPLYEKLAINKCRAKEKNIIIATQMLDSMITNPRATRAEVTDIYYAVSSGTDSVMLSGESASGLYPKEAVETMARIAREAEENYNYLSSFENGYAFVDSGGAESAYLVAQKSLTNEARYIFCLSASGRMIKVLSKFRPNAIIVGILNKERLVTKFGLDYGVYTKKVNVKTDAELYNLYNKIDKLKEIAREIGISAGSKIIVSYRKEFKIIKV